jgi:hypothetical protein
MILTSTEQNTHIIIYNNKLVVFLKKFHSFSTFLFSNCKKWREGTCRPTKVALERIEKPQRAKGRGQLRAN